MRPYGRLKLLVVVLVVVIHGALQVVGAASVLPFLAIAADPSSALDGPFGKVYTQITGDNDPKTLIIVSGTVATILLFMSSLFTLVSEYVRARYNMSLVHWLHVRMMRHYASLPYSFFITRNSALLIRAVTSFVAQFSITIVAPLLASAASVCTAGMLIIAILIINPVLTLVGAFSAIAAFAMLFVLLNPIMKENTRQRKLANDNALIAVQSYFNAMKAVQVHGASDELIRRYSKFSLRQSYLETQVPVFGALPKSILEPLAFGGIIIYVSLMTLADSSMTDILPTLALLVFVGYRTLPAIQNIYACMTRIVTAAFVLEEITGHLSSESRSMRDVQIEISWQDGISLNDVAFQHEGAEAKALENLTLSIPKGSKTGIVGTTGSGKSTLVDLLLGLHQPSAGVMKIDDQVYSTEMEAAWRKKIGYVPQEIVLLHDSVESNIALGVKKTEIDHDRMKRVCEVAQIAGFIENELEDGYRTVVGERGIRLSGGQRQRIGLARALYHEPNILILDEATSALDQTTEKAFMKAVFSIDAVDTYIIVAHRLSTLEECDQLIELENGKVKSPAPGADAGGQSS